MNKCKIYTCKDLADQLFGTGDTRNGVRGDEQTDSCSNRGRGQGSLPFGKVDTLA